MKFFIVLIFLVTLMIATNAHYPVYSLYKERRPVDLFRALSMARQQKRRIGGFDEMYPVPNYD